MRDDVLRDHPFLLQLVALALFAAIMIVPIIWGDSDEHLQEPHISSGSVAPVDEI